MKISGHGKFSDPGIGKNNPVEELYQEACRTFLDRNGDEKLLPNLKCIVSIGTGVKASRPDNTSLLGLKNRLQEAATEADETAESFFATRPELNDRYIRLSVDGLQDVPLDAAGKMEEIRRVTETWLEKEEAQRTLNRFAGCLLSRQSKGEQSFYRRL